MDHDAQTRPRTVTLDAEQTNIVLGSLYARKVELKHNLSSYSDVEHGPEPTDLCCQAHRMRFERRAQERASLEASQRDVVALIEPLETEGSRGSEPFEPTGVDLERITLVYRSEVGEEYDQSLSDITSVGTLIDPDTGDDLELVSARLEPEEPHGHHWINSLPREIAAVMLDRGDDRSVRAAQWLAGHENDDRVWEVLGETIDRLTDVANG